MLRSNRRFYSALTALAVMMVMHGTAAAGQPAVEWETSRDIAGEGDGGLVIVPDGAGGAYAIGATPIFAGGEDIVVIRYDAAGNEQWMQLFDGVVLGGHDLPVDAVVDADGNLYITGESESEAGDVSPEWLTFKVAADDGAKLWEQRFHGSGTFGFALPRDMAMGPEGEIVVVGWSRHDETFTDFGIVKYDADGNEQWSREFSSPGFQTDTAEAVVIDAEGNVIVTGLYVLAGDRVVGTVKLSAAGDVLWSRTFDASTVSALEDQVQSVAVDENGNIYVAADGINNFTDGRDFVLLKYSPDGTLVWDRRVIEPTADILPVVLIGPEGTIYVSGAANAGHRLVAFDADGTQLWTRTQGGALLDQSRRRHAVIDADGHITILLRTIVQPGIAAYTLVRYNVLGEIVDETVTDPDGMTQSPTALVADAAGNLFATGWWLPNGNRDILTYKFALQSNHLPGDLNSDGAVNVTDLLLLLGDWGACAGCGSCAADLNGDCAVNVGDLLLLLSNWG